MGRLNEGKSNAVAPIQQLRPNHRSIARTLVAMPGARPKDLVEIFGLTEGQISRIIGSPLFQAYLAHLEEGANEVSVELHKDIAEMAKKAVLNLDEDLDLEPLSIDARRHRAKVSLEVLSYAIPKKDGPRGSSITLNQQINVGKMSTKELADDVFSIIEG